MKKKDRRTAIANFIDAQGFVELRDLSTTFNVGGETMRTDLIALEAEGRIEKVYGGAQPVTAATGRQRPTGPLDLMLSERAQEQTELKRSIAAVAVRELPEHNGLVILDAGSSVSQLAATFPSDRRMQVVTNSVEIAAELAGNQLLDVTVTGGRVQPGALSVLGGSAATEIARVNADVAFISADAASLKRGLLSIKSDEADLKGYMIAAADRVVALLDHTKFSESRGARIAAASWDDIDVVITDTRAPRELLEQLRKRVDVRVAPPRRVVGVDIGGHGTRACIIDVETGTLVGDRVRRPTPKPSTVESVVEVVGTLVNELNWNGPVGVAMPGKVKNGKITTKTQLDDSWYRTNAAGKFSEKLQRPVTVINDADAAGRAEVEFGAGAGVDGTIIMLVIGTGVGSFKLDNGSPVANTEFGHTPLKVASAHDLTRLDKIEELGEEEWAKNVNELLEVLTAKHQPRMIIIGGGIAKQFDKIESLLHAPDGVELVVAKARNRAEMIGAAYWRSAMDRALMNAR